MKIKKLTLIRVGIILFYLACIIFFIYVLIKNPLENNVYIKWLFHNSEEFACPACGLTRAIYCLATFRFKEAFYYHAFFVVFLPVTAYIVITLTVNLFAGKKVLPYPKKYSVYLYIYFGLYVAFAILRNFTDVIL